MEQVIPADQERRRSIPPKTLLKGKVLQALFTVRSDRQLTARMQTDLMFRWFVDLPADRGAFDASTYSKNQSRLLRHPGRRSALLGGDGTGPQTLLGLQ